MQKASSEKQEIADKYENRLREKNSILEKCQWELNQAKGMLEQLRNRENTLTIERDSLAKKVEFYKLSSSK